MNIRSACWRPFLVRRGCAAGAVRIAVFAFVLGVGGAGRAETPVTCRADKDCPVLPCGPCSARTLITRERLTAVACYRNPCRAPNAMCRADGVCVVGE